MLHLAITRTYLVLDWDIFHLDLSGFLHLANKEWLWGIIKAQTGPTCLMSYCSDLLLDKLTLSNPSKVEVLMWHFQKIIPHKSCIIVSEMANFLFFCNRQFISHHSWPQNIKNRVTSGFIEMEVFLHLLNWWLAPCILLENRQRQLNPSIN